MMGLGLGILGILLGATLLAALVSVVLCRLVMGLGVVDPPDGVRKTQPAPVPTSGGLGFGLAALLAASAAILLGFFFYSEAGVAIAIGSVAALMLGFADDRFNVPARWKLIAMIAIALGMVALGVRVDGVIPWPEAIWTLPLWLGAAGSILWLVVVMNAVNFMDGANGLAMGMSLIAALGLAVMSFLAGAFDAVALSLALAGALAGFLVWNVPGRLFAGDAGALFVGAMLGGLSLLVVNRQPEWIWLPPLLLLPILTDVLLTLAWRGKNGKPLFSAHRDHAYQIALKAGLKHWQVAAIHGVAAVNALGVAVIAAIVGGWFPLAGFVLMLLAAVWLHLRVRASGVKAGLVGRDVV